MLGEHVHCRNCNFYSAAAVRLLDRALAETEIADATRHFASPRAVEEALTQSVVVFRVGVELLALSTSVVMEVAPMRAIHSLPHRKGTAVLGIANVRGELLVCLALAQLLGVQSQGPKVETGAKPGRLLIVQDRGGRVALPVDEVAALHRFNPADAQPAPAAVVRTNVAHTRSMITWNKQSVGWLAEERVFDAIHRNLA